ncbi:translation elongation factor Ts [Mycoplasma zalophi]|uniref:translation elongation factor Ts n=1 Tax=Mycoplasma zalophi TaxID=191287 RepID=UPI001C0FC183|nr:translation elongation factor Ts [Mycoplasma zalophi]MBU4690880.1 translation elongation factor Ts [Mycoplasma zalophi]MCU4117206.1 translation elongation factor Ts [Mycoplasma zalophi]
MAADLKLIKELRERTNSGFLDVKKALEETNNDIEAAIKWLQEHGVAKAAKKASRIAAEGIVKASHNDKYAVVFELNSETDFVAKNDLFKELVVTIEKLLLENEFTTLEDVLKLKVDGVELQEMITNATAKIGEKITLRRVEKVTPNEGEVIATYTHANERIATIILAKGSNQESLRNVAMHVAALNPSYDFETQLPEELATKIKETALAEVKENPKFDKLPEKVQNDMLQGKLRKAYNENNVLVFQPFVMEDSKTVAQYMHDNNLELISSLRFEVGEGIEVKHVNFADEVAEQMGKK